MNLEHNHIIVGLGGTGGNVIKTFRQQVVDKYGDIQGIDATDNIDFLYIDSNASEFADEKWEYQGKNIKLQGNSTLLLKAGGLKNVLDNHAMRPVFLGRDSEWGELLKDKELSKKAGNQMRRLGRVNLIPNISQIVDVVKSKHDLLSNNKMATTVVHVVAGLAGGTGSGSVVDVTAQLLRTFDKSSSKVKINLYLKLPEVQVPNGWGGQFDGISFYQVNGYAALKEINGLASGTFHPFDIKTIDQKVGSDSLFQAAYLFTDENDDIRFSDVISPISSLLFLKTITADTEKEDDSEQSLPQKLLQVDTIENNTLTAGKFWGLAAKFRVPGIFKIGVPKVQIRESFAYMLVLNAFNKLVYQNYDDVGGKGYLAKSPIIPEIQREKNHIVSNLRSALLDEWFLTFDYLILDEPMIDPNNKLLTEGRDDYSFKVAYKKEYSKQYTLLSTTKQYKGKFIEEKEILKYLQISINDFFNKDYKGLGYERYYSNMLNNLSQTADFICYRIKSKLFAEENSGYSRKYPLESYLDVLLCITQEYFSALERELKNKQLEYSKLVSKKQKELQTINEEYIKSFGIFGSKSILGSSKKREIAIGNFNASLEQFWYYTISLKGINFCMQLLNSHLKSKLLEVKHEIETDIKKIVDRRNKVNQEYELERLRLDGDSDLKGFEAITNSEGLEKFQTALMKDKARFDEVVEDLEKSIFQNKNKVFQSNDIISNKELPIMKMAYQKINDLLSEKNFQELVKEDDSFYNAHVVEVLFNKYNRNANDVKLKELLEKMVKFSSPLAKVNGDTGGMEQQSDIIVVLPQLHGIKQGNTEIIDFYREFKKVIESCITNCKIMEVKDERFKNEITIAQFLWPVRLNQLQCVDELRLKYDGLKYKPQIKFLMHTENVSDLADLMPPKNVGEFKKMLLPYLMIIGASGEGFERYGDQQYMAVSGSLSAVDGAVTDSDQTVKVHLESATLEEFLKVDFQILNEKNCKNSVGDNSKHFVGSFINPDIFNLIRTKAESILQGRSESDIVVKKSQEFLEEYLVQVKNDSTDVKYTQFRDSFSKVKQIAKQ